MFSSLSGRDCFLLPRTSALFPIFPSSHGLCRTCGWVRLHEKGGKEHEMPTHHNLDNYLEAYIASPGISKDRKGPLFRTTRGRSGELTGNSLLQSDVWRMIRRRALAAGIETEIGCHTFRATGITAYLKNGGKLEIAQQMTMRSLSTSSVFKETASEMRKPAA